MEEIDAWLKITGNRKHTHRVQMVQYLLTARGERECKRSNPLQYVNPHGQGIHARADAAVWLHITPLQAAGTDPNPSPLGTNIAVGGGRVANDTHA